MNLRTSAVRLGLLPAGIAIALTPAFAANAQEQSAPSTTTLDRIEITGSRIRSVDVETAQPVFTVTQQDIQKSGLVSVGDILQNLSIAGTQTYSKAAVLTSDPEQGGQYVNLYNLGENRTLVLVNGKRWTSSLSGLTDMSTIPSSLIERIEVLKDGASAIYGSDAVAGVVNIILRQNYDGAEASAYFGQNGRGDGSKEQYSFTAGTTTDRSSLVFGANYTNEDPVWARDRALTRYSAGPNHIEDSLSATGPWGRFTSNDQTYILNHTGSFDGRGVGADSRNIANYHNEITTDDYYNSVDQMMLQQSSRNKSIFTTGSYNLTDSLTFKSTAMYSERDSNRQIAGYPLQASSQPQFPVAISGTSYYNPVGQDINSWFRRTVELPRTTESNVKTLHFDAALEGVFDVGSHGWNWDVGFNYNKYDVTQVSRGNINLLALQKALGPSFLNAQGQVQCGTAASPLPLGTSNALGQCTPFNILGGPSASTPNALQYINALGQATQQSLSKQWTANITGGLFDLPAGELGLAAGVEHREISGYDYPDQLSSAGYTTDLAAQATEGRYQTNEAYLELLIPVLKDLPGAKELSFDVAARYSNYSRFGDTTNSKFSFTWKPIDDLLVRGTYGTGFRAPTLSDTFGGGSQTFDTFTDPCDATFGSLGNAGVAARCAGEGLPAGFRQTDTAGNAVTRRDVQGNAPFNSGVGNAELEPEYSITRTVGMVYSPHWVQGLDFSLDWYRISISNIITSLTANDVLNNCYLNSLASYCADYGRDAVTGQVTTLSRGNVNLGRLETEGYNFGVRYRMPETAYGKFAVNLDTNYLATYKSQAEAGAEWANAAGYWNFPRVRATLGLDWSLGALSANWNLRYYGGFRDYCWDAAAGIECNDPNYQTPNPGWGGGTGSNKKGSISYQDVSVTWQAPWDGSVTVGARNIWNKQPPVTYSITNSSTAAIDPMLDYDRFLFVQYNQRF
ncbi:TonB-dependent receptor plug domain-containing protein [Xanthomonas campestris]|uniref:TonB-dependent receptor plug domain-containing protein n=1 Tax=Xanthomonas campestris TaxID=339 RepID=UPI001E370885|nr:TonB-dependent receptor [Xanthomonas campestris]MCC8686046.1 TonB-dependent receptor [Xanthomonas campestris]MCC8691506.1 TonB-dependent receptor [Xanthomonas campestris]MCW1998155.1 iron complex outermembrane receptor protein [Xanthomonas campestris]MEA9677616.1 TonB-dependent receptor [Xanthomonas campestris pv. raphani]MEA9697804.1 TonB-dependent receptor [Xanthomonas campestris pv. raphani]